jgi:predicted RNA-binding Zn-ribbon protein involved in translation (DUF1610 family)
VNRHSLSAVDDSNELQRGTGGPLVPEPPTSGRVCPDCGEPAGAQPFCSSCGVNLASQKRLPTRDEWKAIRAQAEEKTRPKASVCLQCLSRFEASRAICPHCGSGKTCVVPDPGADPDAIRAAIAAKDRRPADFRSAGATVLSWIRRNPRWSAVGGLILLLAIVLPLALSGGGGEGGDVGYVTTKLEEEIGVHLSPSSCFYDGGASYTCYEGNGECKGDQKWAVTYDPRLQQFSYTYVGRVEESGKQCNE